MSTKRRYGVRRNLPDHRDIKFDLPFVGESLPALVDLRPKFPPVYDQGPLGSCTANAGAGAFQFTQRFESHKDFVPARLALYYWTRLSEGTQNSDAGASIRDTCKTMAKMGVPPESLYPYDVSRFTQSPPQSVVSAASSNKVLAYAAVDSSMFMTRAILSLGLPVFFGFTVYQSFESAAVAKSGVMPMPSRGEPTVGGHAVLAVGYDDSRSVLICRNSWAASWGQAGYFTMPYAFYTGDNVFDRWVLQGVV